MHFLLILLLILLSADMEKFPLRMKDNDLLVTELYRDPRCEKVTALSVYLTPKSCKYYRNPENVWENQTQWLKLGCGGAASFKKNVILNPFPPRGSPLMSKITSGMVLASLGGKGLIWPLHVSFQLLVVETGLR